MAHPMGESKDGVLKLDFDRRLKLEFHGSNVGYKRLARENHLVRRTVPG